MRFQLGREMALAFIPNPLNLSVARPRDGDPTNLRLSNWTWAATEAFVRRKHIYNPQQIRRIRALIAYMEEQEKREEEKKL